MKKLLLFVVILFSTLSVQSFAWNYGCGENIPPEVCGAGSGPSQPTIGLTSGYGAIAINTKNGVYFTILQQSSSKTAKEIVMSECGEDCTLIPIASGACTAIASSVDGKYSHDTAAATLLDIGKNTRKERAGKKAIKKCEKNGGKNCLIETAVCADGS